MKPREVNRTSIWSGTYINLLLVSLFQSLGQTMMNTVVPLYANYLGAVAQLVGFATGAMAITALIMRPVFGPAFDSLNRKWLTFAAAVTILIASVLYSLADSYVLLVLARLIHGLGISCSAPLLMAMAGDSLPEEKMNTGLSVYGLAFALASAVGPALGVYLVDTVGYSWTFHFATAVVALACVMVFVLKEPGEKRRQPYEFKLSRMFAKEAILPAVLIILICMPYTCISSFIVLFGNLKGIEGMGYYFTVYAIGLLVSRPIFGWLSDRFGAGKIIPVCLLFFASSLIGISVAQSLLEYLLAAAIGSFGYGAVLPLFQSLSFTRAPIGSRGAASNTNFTGLDIGTMLGPVLGGTIIGALSGLGLGEVQAYAGMYLLAVMPVALAFVLFLMLRKTLMRKAS